MSLPTKIYFFFLSSLNIIANGWRQGWMSINLVDTVRSYISFHIFFKVLSTWNMVEDREKWSTLMSHYFSTPNDRFYFVVKYTNVTHLLYTIDASVCSVLQKISFGCIVLHSTDLSSKYTILDILWRPRFLWITRNP